MFELTHIYKIWYNDEPKFSKLKKDLLLELEKYPAYYKRIKKIGEIGDTVISFNTD